MTDNSNDALSHNRSADRDPAEKGAPNVVHVINHTHWDREWFLTQEYTTAWIPDLIDSLRCREAENAGYQYLFDGQSLVIEDLLKGRPEYRPHVEELITKQTLHIGPVYSQPDWRMLSGQLHVRNLTYGTDDAASLGGQADVAWLVDTFGHISQAPQLLSMVGVDAAFVWRGVPEMKPVFLWEGANGGQIPTVNLFGGYRNLYGVTKTPEIAAHRLDAETRKLAPYYGDVPIPLFDGYDLDTEPEDPVRYYRTVAGVPEGIVLKESSPRAYIDAVSGDDHPVISGELISGRYGSTFPGTLSARTYLKVLHNDAEHALQLLAEPLAVLAHARGRTYPARTFEAMARELLQNGVHDCICGVSVDQVHERMDRSYRRLLGMATADAQASLERIFAGFAAGSYALSTNAMKTTTVQRANGAAVVSKTTGIGARPIAARHLISKVEEPASGFGWRNGHYNATVNGDGVMVDGRPLGRIVVRVDDGDTYSSEAGPILGTCWPTEPPVIEDRSEVDTVIRYSAELNTDEISVRAMIRVRFDTTPIVHVTVDLDSDGTGYRADMEFETGVEAETVFAGMPFDLVERPHQDLDLLPKQVTPELDAVLMGQREVQQVDEFPFQGLVAARSHGRTCAVLAKGIRSYGSTRHGRVSVALRRSVEWLAKSGLTYRQGDAGPAMYVPGARSERTVRHEIGFVVLPAETEETAVITELWRLNEGFQNPPVLVEVDGSGTIDSWDVFAEELPAVGFEVIGDQPVVRVFNPEDQVLGLDQERNRVSVRGADLGVVNEIAGKEILSLAVAVEPPVAGNPSFGVVTVRAHNLPTVRVGRSRSRPDPQVMDELRIHREDLQQKIDAVMQQIRTAEGAEWYRLTHEEVVLAREEAEVALSLELNRRLAASTGTVSIPDEIDPEIAALGSHLNDLRVKRRIYDYVVQAL